jgi:hypothetical protein
VSRVTARTARTARPAAMLAGLALGLVYTHSFVR